MSTAELSPAESFANHRCFHNGGWVGYANVLLSVDDLGFRQGVTAVERLRTYGGQVFSLTAHLQRWQKTLQALMISGTPDHQQCCDLVQELLQRNRSLVDACGDVGITMFATPGEVGGSAATFAIHLNRLDTRRNQQRRESGQPLMVTEVRQVDPLSWPRHIKVRCRLHYYLADAQARRMNADAVGVLLDQDGSVTETSIANLAMVEGSKILSPLPSQILGGISQQVVEQLARELSIPWTHTPIMPERLRSADEVLLMGTDTGLWFANRVDQSPIHQGQPGPIYQQLAKAFHQRTHSK